MNWASVIEELERQAAFADSMSAKNTIDQEIAKAFGQKAEMLIAISARLRYLLEQEDYNNGIISEEGQWAAEASDGNAERARPTRRDSLRPTVKAYERRGRKGRSARPRPRVYP